MKEEELEKEKIEDDNLHFKTNIQLKSIIGKDLINDDNIAVLELVKNSFDADAKKVSIKFINLKENDDKETNAYSKNTSRIVIEDDGVGMTLLDVKNKWLNIAYSEKKTNNRQYNRMMAGAKGVGRFSCDRLGEYLNLYTRVKGSNSYLQLKIDWKLFEVENAQDREIQSIVLEHNFIHEDDFNLLGFEPFNHGVLLEIIKLRSTWAYPAIKEGKIINWDVYKFVELKKYLEKLINPNQAFENNDFGIYIDTPEFVEENNTQDNHNKFIGKVENRIFEKLDFQSTSIESEIIDDGKTIFTQLKDKGETIFWIKEKNNFFPLIVDAKIFLYYLNPYAKAFFTRQTGIRSVDYGSIFLFINGFRVPPYGEVGNDWLGIDQRKAQGYARNIGLREFVGRIEIMDNHNDFQIISSREGIVRNENYNALTSRDNNESYFFKTLRRLEKYVVDGLAWDSSIYDPKDPRFREIEKKIISGNYLESDLRYREKNEVKQRRIYESIHSIIGAKPSNVIELYINESLISNKIEEERGNSEREYNQLLSDFENKKIDSDTLSRILLKKAGENKELEKQIKEFSRYTTNEVTSKAILDLQQHREQILLQSRTIEGLKNQLEIVEKEKEKAESEKETILEELTETKSQNIFLKSIKSQDLSDVLNLMHQIGISTSSIQHYIKGTIFRLDNNIDIKSSELKNIFSRINYEINRIHSISKLATRANFKSTVQDAKLNIIDFIEQYFLNVVKPFLPTSIEIIIRKGNMQDFTLSFKPLELTIVLDNLLSNSRKANSSKIEIVFNDLDDGSLNIIFRDNGNGIDDKNKDQIFDFGFTTTEGSGLGLGHIKDIIEKMGGKIKLNNLYRDGAEFIINLKNK